VGAQAVQETPSYTIGGTVSGLARGGLVLQNNGGNSLAVSIDGAFSFSSAIVSGGTYSVTVLTPPSGQRCAVANASGSIASANVTNVTIACASPPAAPTLGLGFGVKDLRLSWPAVSGADFYRLFENPDGVSGYTQVGADLTTLGYNHRIPVHGRLNAGYVVEACNSAGCTASAPQILGTHLTQAIGYVKASNTAAGDSFGIAVALSTDGNTLAVGANGEDSCTTGIGSKPRRWWATDAGAVYVFTRSAGTWLQQAYVKASNTRAGDAFGISVALSGDGNTLAVGANGEDSGSIGVGSKPNKSAPNAGAVYVFTRSAGNWKQQAYVKSSNTRAGNRFGTSVALSGDGDTLAVGAYGEAGGSTAIGSTQNKSAFFSGAAYVFARSAGTWSQEAYVKASNAGAGDLFGFSVALSGDGNTLAVGAINEDSSSIGIGSTPNELATDAGAVYVFARGAGGWSQQAYVKTSNSGASDQFGFSVALNGDGNTLAVGAIGEAGAGVGSTPNRLVFFAGAVYVFTRSAGNWSQQAYVKASNTGTGDQFGISVALSGDGNTLAVGAPFEDSSTAGVGSLPNDLAADAGAVYVFTRRAGAWSPQAYVKASNSGTGDNFGISVGLSGDGNTLAVGAIGEDSSTKGIGSTPNELASQAGAVYLY